MTQINQTILKNQEQDRKDREQYELAFKKSMLYQLTIGYTRTQESLEGRFFDREKFNVAVDSFSKVRFDEVYEDMETKSDLVDDALMYGIKARFYKYLDAMSDFNLIEDQVAKQQEAILEIKKAHVSMRESGLIIKEKVVLKKIRHFNQKAVLDILSMFETINVNLNQIEAHVNLQEYNDAVALYKKQEEILFNKLKGYCLTEKFEIRLNKTRSQMITSCASFVKNTLSHYVTECFEFSKKKPEGMGDASRLIQEMTLIANSSMNMSMDVSIIERFEHNSVPLYLAGAFEPTNKEDIDYLGNVISNYLSIKDFKLEMVAEDVSKMIRPRVKEVNIV